MKSRKWLMPHLMSTSKLGGSMYKGKDHCFGNSPHYMILGMRAVCLAAYSAHILGQHTSSYVISDFGWRSFQDIVCFWCLSGAVRL